MINSTMIEAVEQVDMRPLSEAELEAVAGGMCDMTTVQCPIGHLVIWNNCPTSPVVSYTTS